MASIFQQQSLKAIQNPTADEVKFALASDQYEIIMLVLRPIPKEERDSVIRYGPQAA